MATVIDLAAWRRGRGEASRLPERAGHGEGPAALDRLERAVELLAPLVARVLDAGGRVEPRVETELLAIIGELTVGLIPQATGRAERLARRLEEVR